MNTPAHQKIELLLLVTLVVGCGSVSAMPGATPPATRTDGELVSQEPVTIPSWADAVETTDADRYATESEYAAAAADRSFSLSKLWYRSDGLDVAAYLYVPVQPSPTSLPVIIFNRGSFIRGEIAPELLPMFHRLGKAGFAVVAPLLRGSAGAEGKDEMGGSDLDDLMNVAKLVPSLRRLDSARMFLYGESRGGMMVLQAMREGFPARAAATYGAFTDLRAMVASERGEAMAHQIWPDFDERREAIIERRSAIDWSDRIDLPLLIMHGGADKSVSPAESLRFALELEKNAAPYELIVFAGDDHVLSDHRIERDERAADWFRSHM